MWYGISFHGNFRFLLKCCVLLKALMPLLNIRWKIPFLEKKNRFRSFRQRQSFHKKDSANFYEMKFCRIIVNLWMLGFPRTDATQTKSELPRKHSQIFSLLRGSKKSFSGDPFVGFSGIVIAKRPWTHNSRSELLSDKRLRHDGA